MSELQSEANAKASDFSVNTVELLKVANGRVLQFARVGAETAASENQIPLPVNGTISGTIEGMFEGKFGPELLLGNESSVITIRLSGPLKVALARAKASEGSNVVITYKGKKVITTGRMAGKSAHSYAAAIK